MGERVIRLLAVLIAIQLPLLSQSKKQDPVQWSLSIEPDKASPGGRVLARLKATIDPGWHLYSTTTPQGPIPTKIGLVENANSKASKLHQPAPTKRFDPNFNADSETYENEAVFLIESEIAASAPAGPMEITAQARYQVCSDTVCLRPVRKTAAATLQVTPGAAASNSVIPAGYVTGSLMMSASAVPDAPKPAGDALKTLQPGGSPNQDLVGFLAVAFGFGLVSIFTPCVFPMIPFIVTFFLSQAKDSKSSPVAQASIFCLGIVVLLTAIGLVTTAALGPLGVVQLGSNPWVNFFITAVFLVFGLSLLGAFELTLPSGLLTRLDQASQRGGFGGTLLMGLTFSLTSFACVGPFLGTILASSVQGGGFRPAIGMAAYAAGLAAPFFLLALFPSYLQRLPKSGGWLPRVKVVMGFVILAVMFKYLSNIDQVNQWGILTRERFLAVWIILFTLPGLYLLGLLRMEGIKPDENVGVARVLFGAAFLVFSVSLIPGLSCGRLGDLDAYVPACAGEPSGAAATGPKWLKNDYKGALAKAKAENRLVLVSFTGYACSNCHWMKANMMTRPEIAAVLRDFILVELYTDGTDAASEEFRNLQENKFQTVAIPHYVILDGDERVLASSVGRTTKTGEFLSFLTAPQQAKTAGI